MMTKCNMCSWIEFCIKTETETLLRVKPPIHIHSLMVVLH